MKHAIKDYANLEVDLVKRGAKTFKKLYPKIEEPDHPGGHFYGYNYKQERKPFEVAFSFRIGELTDKSKELYLKL